MIEAYFAIFAMTVPGNKRKQRAIGLKLEYLVLAVTA
jgi:hypothetical protein